MYSGFNCYQYYLLAEKLRKINLFHVRKFFFPSATLQNPKILILFCIKVNVNHGRNRFLLPRKIGMS